MANWTDFPKSSVVNLDGANAFMNQTLPRLECGPVKEAPERWTAWVVTASGEEHPLVDNFASLAQAKQAIEKWASSHLARWGDGIPRTGW